MIRLWKRDSGNRSSRAPAFTGTAGSFLPRKHGQTADGQGFGCQAAILVKRILLRRLEKFFAIPRGIRIEAQDAHNKVIYIGGESAGRADVRDEPDFPRLLRRDGIAKKHERKRKARQRVLPQISHDRSWSEAEFHFGESQGGTIGDVDKIAYDSDAESEAERIALDLRDADQRRNSQGALEFDKARGFVMDRRGVPACALAPRAKDFASRAQAQDTRTRIRCFAPKLREHRVKHRASDFIAMLRIIQREVQDIARPLDYHADWRMRGRRFNRFGGHSDTVHTECKRCQRAGNGTTDFLARCRATAGSVCVRLEEHENDYAGDRNIEPNGEGKTRDSPVHRESTGQREKERREYHRQRDDGKDYVAG